MSDPTITYALIGILERLSEIERKLQPDTCKLAAPKASGLFTHEDIAAIEAARVVARKAFTGGESKSRIERVGLEAMNALADLNYEIKRT